MREADKDAEAEHWQEKINFFVQTIVEQTCREPIEDYDAAISTLDELDYLISHDELEIKLKRAILELTEKKPDAKEAEIIEAKQNLLSELWDFIAGTEHREEIKQLFEEIESYYRKNLPTSREDFVKTLSDHGDFLKLNDQKSVAIEKLSEALDLLEKDSEPYTDEILRTMRDIANVFWDAGNYSEEAVWCERILNFCREHFTEDAPETLEALDELVGVYERLKDYDRAEQFRYELNTLKGKNLGDSHIDSIHAKEELADTLHDSEKYDEEIKLREEIVALYRKNFSSNAGNKKNSNNYWFFVFAMNNLADCLDEQERKAEALAVRKQIVDEEKERVQTLKDNYADDEDIIAAMGNLADALHAIENFDEEIKLREEIVDLYREKFSANPESKEEYHWDFIRAMNKLVDCLDEQERKAEALEVRKQIVDEEKKHVQTLKDNSADDDDIINAMWKLAYALHAIKDFDEERKLREQIVDKEKERVQTLKDNSADADDIISAMGNLADALHAIEDFDEERKLREQIVELWRENFSANPESKEEYHWNFIAARANLALSILCANQHDGDERIKTLEQLNAILEETIEIFDADSYEAKTLLETIADARKKIKDDAQALKKFDELFGAYYLPQDDDADKTSATEDDLPEEISATEDDSPDETSPTEIDASDSLELRKGQRVPLAKDNSALDKLTVDFRWEGDADLEIDASAFLLGKDEKAHADEDFIFYGNDESGGVKYISGDGQATMQVALKNISDDVAKISFSLTIYDADERKQNFGGTKIFARIVDETTRKEILHFDLTDNFTIETAVIIGEIYRHKGTWKFNAVGAGFSGGLKALCKNFGLEVD